MSYVMQTGITRRNHFPEGALATIAATVFENSDLKPSTRQTYLRAIHAFIEWFEEGEERHDPATVIRFKRALEGRSTLSAATKNLYLNAARALYRRLFELGELDRNLGASVRGFDASRKHKRAAISDAQLKAVREYLKIDRDSRLRVIFDLLFRQGLRRNEVVTLRVSDISLVDGAIAVLGKGRDDREMTPMHPETRASLEAYFEDAGVRDGYLFPSRGDPTRHLTTTRLYQLVMAVHADLGITNSVHGYRKAFTSRLIDSGMNLLTVQQFTRHRSLDMLKIYYDRIDQQKAMPLFVAALA